MSADDNGDGCIMWMYLMPPNIYLKVGDLVMCISSYF